MINVLIGSSLHRYLVTLKQEDNLGAVKIIATDFFSELYYAHEMEALYKLYKDVVDFLRNSNLIGVGKYDVEFQVVQMNAIVMN